VSSEKAVAALLSFFAAKEPNVPSLMTFLEFDLLMISGEGGPRELTACCAFVPNVP
jgi:hypothetical protein